MFSVKIILKFLKGLRGVKGEKGKLFSKSFPFSPLNSLFHKKLIHTTLECFRQYRQKRNIGIALISLPFRYSLRRHAQNICKFFLGNTVLFSVLLDSLVYDDVFCHFHSFFQCGISQYIPKAQTQSASNMRSSTRLVFCVYYITQSYDCQ